MEPLKQKWIVEETWAEVIEWFDSLVATREEAVTAWEKCYGRALPLKENLSNKWSSRCETDQQVVHLYYGTSPIGEPT